MRWDPIKDFQRGIAFGLHQVQVAPLHDKARVVMDHISARRFIMIDTRIKAIFFDVGNTLRTHSPDQALDEQAMQGLVQLLGAQESLESFCDRLSARYRAYQRWANETLIEAPETEIWTRWMLPDWPREQIEPLAQQLTLLWRRRGGRRIVRPDARCVMTELRQRSYCLGVISNTISTVAVPRTLAEHGLIEFFSAVVLSSTFGRRKPDPGIFWEATRLAGVNSEECAYVGDRPTCDVLGSRRAGFPLAIIIHVPDEPPEELPPGVSPAEMKPDLLIYTLGELLSIFPSRKVLAA